MTGKLALTTQLETLDRDELISTVRRLLAEADALSSRITAVNEIGIAINQSLDLDKIERVIAKQAKWLLDFDYCSVYLGDAEGWEVTTLFGTEEPLDLCLLDTENIGIVLKTAQPKLILNGSPSPFLSGYASQMMIPLVAEGEVFGTIIFAAVAPHSYNYNDMRIGYMLALQLSSAIRNARVVKELRRTQDELRLRVEELDAYSYTIAHDLKSPLSSIILTSDLLRRKFGERLQPDGLRIVSTLYDSARQMDRMIDQLLWLAKVRKTNEEILPVEVSPIAQAAAARFLLLLESRGITLRIAPDLPSALGHEQWVEEIFANLISNAIKYMGTAHPAPLIEVVGFEDGDWARYEVRDTGVGIKPEDSARLFEMFTRLHTVQAEGLGLGLSIVHRMVTQLRGQVGVESVYGQGSTFWFTLPMQR
jgi:signal transduction histidine kinase